MSLIEQVNNIQTDWKDIILKWTKESKVLWDNIEQMYANELERHNGFLKIFPEEQNIFRCFNYFNLKDTKVVILGQDPYHGENQATGLCFGVNDVKMPPSLKNIEKELVKDYNKKITDKTLEKWAKQNVLLLNVSLTVVEKNPRSHLRYWTPFTYFILHNIAFNCNDVVFVVWGGFALNVMANVQPDTRERGHKLVISSHPSPLGYGKTLRHHHSFKDSGCFKKINSLLEKEIDW